jgi:hypothetical protein
MARSKEDLVTRIRFKPWNWSLLRSNFAQSATPQSTGSQFFNGVFGNPMIIAAAISAERQMASPAP